MSFFSGGATTQFHEERKQREVTALLKERPGVLKTGEPFLDAFRQKVLERGGRNGFRSLSMLMKRMDTNGNKMLSVEELADAVASFGLSSKPHEIQLLFHIFDTDKSGSISLKEFIAGMRSPMPPVRRDLVQQAYKLLDANCDGHVTLHDIAQLYDASQDPQVLSGEKDMEDVLREFAENWDRNGDDNITMEEFMEYYHDISSSIENNQYFELMIRNAWHISGGVGPAANTSCRRVLVIYNDGRQAVTEIRNDLGIRSDDIPAMMDRLRQQGLTNIREIKLHM
mmetsp:Transcript_137358/g.238901  ORF Transcript_137358/g.238901 Transcript_137358/m.238901 type:complete len:283 (-) Transcript_137358:1170-2018(-)